MNAETFVNDIPTETARQAYAGVSFSPERRAQQECAGYAEMMAADYAALLKFTEGKPGMGALLATEFERYRQGYRARYLKKLHSDSRCMSWMITGPANFPVRRMEKRNAAAHKRLTEVIEFRERALAAMRKTLCPELRPIMAGDSDACQRLQADIVEAEALQVRMKAANVIVRKFKSDIHNGRLALEQAGFTAGQAKRLFEPDCCGRWGFADFELTNNSANIRRMKARIVGIARNQALPTVEADSANGIRLEDCPAENRVRLFFPGKPDVAIRSKLKGSGFRWAPSIGCWQAYRNPRTLEVAKGMLTA